MVQSANHYTTGAGKTRTKDKYRVVYSDHQRLELEKEFHFSRYITIRRKAEIAQQLGLSERQVKIWFQNRRAKERKQNKKKEEAMRASGNMTTPKLEPLDSPPAISASHHVHGHAHSPNMGMGMGMSQHHVMSQPTMPGAGPVRGMDVAPNHHLPSPVSQAQPQHYQTHRLSPVSSHGVGLDTLPQTATPSVSQQMQVPVVDSCSTASLRTQNVATPIFEEKREIA
nr:hypothetical protein BaRGS_019693 [Batillaria attramentaria]